MRRFSTSWTRTLARLGIGQSRKQNRRPAQRSRFARVEPLESRHMLAVLTVNSLEDNTTASDGLVTFREAIAAANNDTTTDLGHTGSGADTITFDPALFNSQKTITLGSQLIISSDLTVEGPGSELLSISGNNASRVFNVAAGADVAISGLTITAGHAVSAKGAASTTRATSS